ncbi:MAG: hypothetical protein NTY53_07235, partial [Kiritimatiellaeota bacterium]|nr:hypothetical protein [Kiritimatiellota bacterium]
MKSMKKRCVGVCVCAGVLLGGAAQGQTTSVWNTATDGGWGVDGNWSLGVPQGGTNAVLGGSGSYVVTYSNPVSWTIGSLTLTNTLGSITTLNINTNGFNFATGQLANATLNINLGGVVTNTGNFAGTTTTNAVLVINGGTYIQTGGEFGNSSAGASSAQLQLNDGLFVLNNGDSGHFYGAVTMTGGILLTTNGYISPFSSTISGCVWSNTSMVSLAARSSTLTATNQGQLVTTILSVNGNVETIRVDGGSVVITSNEFHVLEGALTGNRAGGQFYQTAGTVSMADATGLIIGYSSGALSAT